MGDTEPLGHARTRVHEQGDALATAELGGGGLTEVEGRGARAHLALPRALRRSQRLREGSGAGSWAEGRAARCLSPPGLWRGPAHEGVHERSGVHARRSTRAPGRRRSRRGLPLGPPRSLLKVAQAPRTRAHPARQHKHLTSHKRSTGQTAKCAEHDSRAALPVARVCAPEDGPRAGASEHTRVTRRGARVVIRVLVLLQLLTGSCEGASGRSGRPRPPGERRLEGREAPLRPAHEPHARGVGHLERGGHHRALEREWWLLHAVPAHHSARQQAPAHHV
mmetsp:Transcript_2190/g.6151  ORF Transcript_2190/g.6151 Transcript_2190/m.6151 type:complete len:279 (-) Transcript_2190:1269-2105(-)